LSARPLTEPMLRAIVAELAGRDGPPPTLVAVEAAPTWEGEPTLQTDIGPVHVRGCVSPLAIRAATSQHVAEAGTLLILTDVDEASIGQEVLGLAWRGRLHRPRPVESLRQLTRVDRLDPELPGRAWLVELLVQVAPTRGYAPPPGGFLSLESAYRLLYRHGLGLPVERPRLRDLLSWASTDLARSAVHRMTPEVVDHVSDHLAEVAGPAARVILRLVTDNRGADAVPLGAVADVLWGSDGDPQLGYVQGRFVGGLPGGLDVSDAARWGRAAVELILMAATDHPEQAQLWTARAEQVLAEVDGLGLAGASEVLPSGLERRLEQAGYALAAVVDDPRERMLEPLEQVLRSVEHHLAARVRGHRVAALRSAVRLARWLVYPPVLTEGGLAELAHNYEVDGGWVDDARDALEGETVAVLADAYRRIIAAVDERRRERDRSFALALRDWSTLPATPGGTVLPIEHVLDQVVAPLAEQTNVLLLIIDGMSHASSHALLDDLSRAGWGHVEPADGALRPVIAATPTITLVSRTSLLTGSLQVGDQKTERAGFRDHAGLRAASGGTQPILFHKADLGDVGGEVAGPVREQLLDTQQRVVGVVVNAFDDHLDKGTQLRLVDGIAGIRPLEPLLAAAAEAGRVIVLTADHGHIREHGTKVTPASGGERWREASSPPSDSEIELTGPRVLLGEGRVVLPATEEQRYNATKKLGYHGGATPAEVLCPLAVLAPSGVQLDGWDPVAPRRPLWWDHARPPSVAAVPAPAEFVPAQDDKGVPLLFGTGPEPSDAGSDQPAWIDELLGGPVMSHQRTVAGRATLDDHELAGILGALVAAGDVLPASVVADHLGVTPLRLRSKLEALRRLLNVDGYPVVTVNDGEATVALDRSLLETQFGVDVP
jgi:hypothetical protein